MSDKQSIINRLKDVSLYFWWRSERLLPNLNQNEKLLIDSWRAAVDEAIKIIKQTEEGRESEPWMESPSKP